MSKRCIECFTRTGAEKEEIDVSVNKRYEVVSVVKGAKILVRQ
jgi:hypothetical protein